MSTATEEKFELIVLDDSGDTRVMWDPRIKDEVDNAEKTFKDMKKKGYLAYTVKKNGDPGEVIREFDPKAGKIIMAPQLVGG